jgi:hypothetical protein
VLLVTALPLRGHVHPMVPLGLACDRAGHDVSFSIPGRYAGRVPLPLRDPPSVADAARRLLRSQALELRVVSALQAEPLALQAPADVVPTLESFARNPRN